jgi:hypothetical protein
MSLPKPVLSTDDILITWDHSYHSASYIWDTWSKDPIKEAVLRAILSRETWLYNFFFEMTRPMALSHDVVCFIYSSSLEAGEVHY